MWLILGAVVFGIVIGLALGGSLRTLSETHFRWWPLALVGLALQIVPVPVGEGRLREWLVAGLLALSYGSLLAFLAVNVGKAGFPLVAAGIALNALVIAINGGMPVSDQALREAYGPGYLDIRRVLIDEGPPKHHLADPEADVLLPLADVIPIGSPVNNVFSVGDFVSMGGIVWVLAAATKGGPGKHRVKKRPRRLGVEPKAGPIIVLPSAEPTSAAPRPADPTIPLGSQPPRGDSIEVPSESPLPR